MLFFKAFFHLVIKMCFNQYDHRWTTLNAGINGVYNVLCLSTQPLNKVVENTFKWDCSHSVDAHVVESVQTATKVNQKVLHNMLKCCTLKG